MNNLLKKIISKFSLPESISESKNKWSALARKNAKYYIWSDKQEATEEEFRDSGKADYDRYVKNDKFLQEQLDKINARVVLEIGCGIGRMSEFFGDDFDKVYGIDIAGLMIAKARTRLPANKFVFLESDGVSLPVDSGEVDFVFSFIVFQHMPSREVVLANFKEANRVLKSGGMFKVQVRGRQVPQGEWYSGVNFDINTAKQLAEEVGFSVLKIEHETERYLWLLLVKSNNT